jgi:hypothetical protein
MSSNKILWIAVAALFAIAPAECASSQKPRVAVFLSRTSLEQSRGPVQSASRGWVGLANLAGFPYDTLFLEEVGDLTPYKIVVLPQCSAISEKTYTELTHALEKYLAAGGNVIVEGPLGRNDETGKERDHNALDALLGLEYGGMQGDQTFRIRTASNDHYITRPFEQRQFLSQPLARGLNILKFKEGGQVLLVSTDQKQAFPFLSSKTKGKSRIVLFSDLSTSAGATSFFRNAQPQGFYANVVLNAATRSVHWAAYGDLREAFPAPQLGNAAVTAIVRHDADGSVNYDYQERTFNYFIQTAKETGVNTLYAIQSDDMRKTGWDRIVNMARELEALGGEIGTHSKWHKIVAKMTDAQWRDELEGSIEQIEGGLKQAGFDIGKCDLFINPDSGIPMENYIQVARSFQFMMTHGYETERPIGFGLMTWFTGPNKDFVVVDNVPAPDYQWLYDPSWSYYTSQAAAYQEAIFDHMFQNIGHGAIFNLMWHDYSLGNTAAPRTRPGAPPGRIREVNHIPLYDAIKAKWDTNDVYCPEPYELVYKIRAMAQLEYSWKSEGNRVEMELDTSHLRLPQTFDFLPGMGIRIENTGQKIQSVTINGQPHFAFADSMVILPALNKGINRIAVTLGPVTAAGPHITYVSKRMPIVRKKGADIEFQMITKAKGRFSAHLDHPSVLLHADWQEYDRKGDQQLNGYVMSDRTLVLTDIKGFGVTRATLPIASAKGAASKVTLALDSNSAAGNSLRFRAAKAPRQVTMAGQTLQAAASGADYEVTLPEFRDHADLNIEF